MYKLTFVLFAFFSLVLPILAVPIPALDEIDRLEKRTAGTVCVFHSYPAHDADILVRREPGIILALAIVVKQIPLANLSSPFPHKSMITELIARRCGSSLSPI
jgi:hypothetical protein